MADYVATDWANGSGGGTPLSETLLDKLEQGAAGSVQKSGNTAAMTGPLILQNASPTLDNHAARKKYVDDSIAAALSGSGNIPVGGIILWSGSIVGIPASWALCDGLNGTPDLRDRFLVGAGSTYSVGGSGGATAHTHTGPSHTHTGPSHDHTISSGGSHDHDGGNSSNRGVTGGGATVMAHPLPVGDSSHNHSGVSGAAGTGATGASGTGATGSTSGLPPYYALAYIMRTA